MGWEKNERAESRTLKKASGVRGDVVTEFTVTLQ